MDSAADVLIEIAGGGIDTVQSPISWTLSGEIERLTLTGTDDVDGIGNAFDNQLIGNSGNNLLDGDIGADTMTGGFGEDNYVVDNSADSINEVFGEGIDDVRASITYTLPSNVENLLLTGIGDFGGIGNALDNTLTGNSGNNALDGAAGADTLIGGQGDDNYLVDNVGDVIIEYGGQGSDLAISTSPSYVLPAEVENLTLVGTARDGTGNALTNHITGNNGQNRLDGGAGADTLEGGRGSDLYIVDNVGDRIVAGNDTLDGGIDSDVAVYSGNLADYQISFNTGSRLLTVTHNGSGADGTDQLLNIETLQFADQSRAASEWIPGRTIGMQAYHWKTHVRLGGVGIGGHDHSDSTDADGAASFVDIPDNVLSLTTSRAIPAGEAAATNQAVNLQDAIAVLKMIVGLDVNGVGRPLTPYQAYAADFDGNGAVNLSDAIGVLKHVVGLSAPTPQWKFFSETDTLAGKAGLNPGTAPTAITDDISATPTGSLVHLGLVGVLRGDVDGSYAGPAGSTLLPGDYFTDHGLNPSRFGIY